MLLDEPTNNLDFQSRNILYQYIESSPQSIILVSHDRKLLNLCNKIIEITSKGIEVYGGNYDFYKQQKEAMQLKLEQDIQARTEILNKSKRVIQTRMERHQRNESRGRKAKVAQIKAKGSYDKLGFKSKKGQSEKTNRRIRLQASRKLDAVNAELNDAVAKLDIQEQLNVCLSSTSVPTNKIVLDVENLTFHYDPEHPLLKHFNLQIIGPDRVAVTGPNGCGKSTLIHLIRNILTPMSGKISIGVQSIAYLDQAVSMLEPTLTIVENFLKLNPTSKPFDAYSALASFKFRNKDAEQMVNQLSGGEKMRAGLAVSLMLPSPPQLIILDEPTNHLDIEAVEALEKALNQYQGAILAVSHDEFFLENIHIKKKIQL